MWNRHQEIAVRDEDLGSLLCFTHASFVLKLRVRLVFNSACWQVTYSQGDFSR